jgi:hypothetical protein
VSVVLPPPLSWTLQKPSAKTEEHLQVWGQKTNETDLSCPMKCDKCYEENKQYVEIDKGCLAQSCRMFLRL